MDFSANTRDYTPFEVQQSARVYTAFVKNNGLNFCDTLSLVKGQIKKAQEQKADLFFLPMGALLGHGLGTLTKNLFVRREVCEIFGELRAISKGCNMVFVTDGAMLSKGALTPALQVLFRGELLAQVPADGADSENPAPFALCTAGNLRFAVVNTAVKPLDQLVGQLPQKDLHFIVASSELPYTLGRFHQLEAHISAVSGTTPLPIVYAEGYLGGSGVPYLHSAFGCIAAGGELLKKQAETLGDIKKESLSMVCDIPLQPVPSPLSAPTEMDSFSVLAEAEGIGAALFKDDPLWRGDTLSTDLTCDPFKAYFEDKNPDFLPELFQMQVKSLGLRLLNTGFEKIILPVSGGLDSTLALLVCLKTLDTLKLPRLNLIAVTMPGLGTGGTSYENAVTLIKSTGAQFEEIDIKKATLGHFADIGHDKTVTDITFENAQARERTQVALDLANKLGAIFVGTGDLSEDALGWCTFGGDHLSNFNVNVCLTKTMVRQMVHYLAGSEFTALQEVLTNILNAPVSPELLPIDGEVTRQKTEEILGDYILHDFFLFCFIHLNLPFEDIYRRAQRAFEGTYTAEQVKSALLIFAKRFFTSQFKRSCQPDATDLTGVNLLGTSYTFSSDLQVGKFIEKLNKTLQAL